MLKDKIAIVTGASRGIGRETALTLASYGAVVIVNYNGSEQKAKEVVAEIEAAGGRAKACQGSVADSDAMKQMMNEVKKEFGRIDILVNNAGITKDNLLMAMKEEEFDSVIDTNLKGAFLCMKHVIRIMMKQRYGRIINMSSIAGHVGGLTSGVDYATTKGAMLTLTKSVAKQGAAYGVTCNSIAPGNIKTAMEKVFGSDWDPMAVPMHRLGEPEDISDVVLFLASDMSRYITGCCLNVNGGLFMQ